MCTCARGVVWCGVVRQVARDEGLFNFAPDTRAGCTVLEGTKQRLALLGRFVVVVSAPRAVRASDDAVRIAQLSWGSPPPSSPGFGAAGVSARAALARDHSVLPSRSRPASAPCA